MSRPKAFFWINAILLGPAAASLFMAVRHSVLRGGADFQWSGAHMLAHRIDPYMDYIGGDPQHRIVLSQVPNYLHELYLLMLPLGWMSEPAAMLVWTLLSLIFLTIAMVCLKRIYSLSGEKTLLLLLLTLLSTPFRIALDNGQQSLLELCCVCLIFVGTGALTRGLALGVSYAKFSFSPVFFFYFAVRHRRMVLISLVPVAAGILLMWGLVGGPLAHLALEPILVSRRGVTVGLGDLMAVFHLAANGHMSLRSGIVLKYVLGLGLSAVGGGMLARSGRSAGFAYGPAEEGRLDAPLLAVTSLLACTHLSYDYVFLAIPLAAAMGMRRGAARHWVAGEVVLLWLGLQFSNRIPEAFIPLLQVGVFCSLATMMGLLLWMRREEMPGHDQGDEVEGLGEELQPTEQRAEAGALVH